jgi:hypothetical protein
MLSLMRDVSFGVWLVAATIVAVGALALAGWLAGAWDVPL